MSYENDAPSEVEDLIEWLIGTQKIANKIMNADRKVDQIRNALSTLSIAPLLNQQFFIDSSLLFAKDPDSPLDTQTMFPRGMTFTGTLDSFNYLLDHKVPVDSLTVNFGEPSVVDPDLDRCDEFKAQIFQVPVLAIDSHFNIGRVA